MEKRKNSTLLMRYAIENRILKLSILVCNFLGVQVCLAQDGNAGIEAANSQVRSYFNAGTQLMYAVGAILGLIGAVKVLCAVNFVVA